jgi:outer membrane protein OmpA-like peptidoglycan-associated protein|tara:strand:+ start:1812 stop:2177 length:366 start_codon:yes stop_codon:yes gene_type:complete
MADTGIFATTAEVGYKAGANASGTSNSEAYINNYMTQVESFINSAVRFNFSDNYSTLNVDTKNILKQIASDLAAIYVIQFDMSGFTTRIEAEDMVNILRDAALRGISILRDKKVQDFINAS